jgi:hypothetical protein
MPTKTLVANRILVQGVDVIPLVSPAIKITSGLAEASVDMRLTFPVGGYISFAIQRSADSVNWSDAAEYETGYSAKAGGASHCIFQVPNAVGNYLRIRVWDLVGTATINSISATT